MIRPILFNSDMVRAILEGRKTVTRRVIKDTDDSMYAGLCGLGPGLFDNKTGLRVKEPLYKLGNILYVRETWNTNPLYDYGTEPEKYAYKASYDGHAGKFGWRPSIHMPKEAARIWLKVTDVKVERLQNITEEQAKTEGAIDNRNFIHSPDNEYDNIHSARKHFAQIWDSTIKKSNLACYGWKANPWVWVVEFERCEKPEE